MSHWRGFDFQITARNGGAARCGLLTTPHGVVRTPNFIFCATKANLKAMPIAAVRESGAEIILGNTYHLMLQPGADKVADLGGLAEFSRWCGPTLTDSGGFQIFSLGHGSVADEIKGRRTAGRGNMVSSITEDGARFRSYVDGSTVVLSPERAIAVQRALGADLILVLDECTPYHIPEQATRASMERSHRWAVRSLKAFQADDRDGSAGPQALYGIIQGGVYSAMRRESAEFVSGQPFFGTAIGGCLGGSTAEMYDVMAMSMAHLLRERPIHLLGIGGVEDILRGVALGIDSFDCVAPTRMARHGGALRKGQPRLNLRNAVHARSRDVIDRHCDCLTCREGYSRGYLHHLLKSKEVLAMTLLSQHNVRFMVRFLAEIRSAIVENRLTALTREYGVDL